MRTFFLGKEFVALSLIKAKNKIFHENFITMSELDQFEHFLQKEFNNRDLDIVITSNTLSTEGFNIIEGVIMESDTSCFDLNFLPMNVLSILYDTKLIAGFLVQLEKEKIEILKKRSEGLN